MWSISRLCPVKSVFHVEHFVDMFHVEHLLTCSHNLCL